MTDIATAAPATSAEPAPLPTLDAIVAAAEARAAGTPAPAAAPAPKTEDKAPTINMDPATLKQITKLQRENRELAAKQKTSDEQAKEVANAIEAGKLMKAGKRLEAMALLAGTDPDTELLALIEDHVKEAPPAEDPLAKKVEEIAKKQELSDKEKAEAKVAADTKAATDAKASAVSFATKQLDTLGKKYELCANADNKVEAAEAALDGVVFLAKERKLDIDKLTQEETAKLFDEAFAAVEAQLEAEGKELAEKLAKRYSKGPKPAPRYDTSNDLDDVPGASRTSPGISIAPPTTGSSVEDIIARAEERIAARRRVA